MKYCRIFIDNIEYAFPWGNLMRLIDGVVLTGIDANSFNFISPYGTVVINARMDAMVDLINDQKFDMIIAALLKCGIDKEKLPIWKS